LKSKVISGLIQKTEDERA